MAATSWTENTVAVVTGGNRGIGYEIVRGLAKAGLSVVLTSRDEGKGLEAVKTLSEEGLQTVHFHPLAVNSTESVKKLANWLGGKFGGIDILVNNAGISFLEVSYENAYKIFDTNFWGVQKVTEGLLPLFKPTGLRRIVIVSSQAGFLKHLRSEELRSKLADVDNLTFEAVEGLAQSFLRDVKAGKDDGWSSRRDNQYSVSKVLLNAWSRVLEKKLASEGIALNGIHPGYVASDMTNRDSKGISIEAGADTPVWLSLLPKDNYPSGKFFMDRAETAF